MANFISKEKIISWATNAQGNVFPITLKETLDIHYKHDEKEEKRKELREMRKRYPLKQEYEKDAYGCHFKDITEEIIRNSDPGEGSIQFEKLRGEFSARDIRAWLKVNSHNGDEMADAIWLRNYLGGDITILADRSREKALVADYSWRSYLWERKEVWGKNSVKKNAHHGYQQITYPTFLENKKRVNENGGLLLTFRKDRQNGKNATSEKASIDDVMSSVASEIRKKSLSKTDIIIKERDSFVILRATQNKK